MKKLLLIFDTPYPFVVGGGQRRLFEIATRLRDTVVCDWLSFRAWTSAEGAVVENIRYIGKKDIPELYSEEGNRNAKEPLSFYFYA